MASDSYWNRDIIWDRLGKINDLNDRKLMKDVLLDVLDNIVGYNMRMYKNLEERLNAEIDDHLDDFAIYTSLENATDIDPVSEFLHPMIEGDASLTIDLSEMADGLKNGIKQVIATVFLGCKNSEIDRLLSEGKSFNGKLVTDNNSYNLSVKAQCCTKYTKMVDSLYRVFQKNNVPWTTINFPYIYKFVDIVLDAPVNLGDDEIVKEITVDLGEYDHYKQVNLIPMWNIKHIEMPESSFPMKSDKTNYELFQTYNDFLVEKNPRIAPAIEKINYEHFLELEDFGIQNGYLVDASHAECPDYLYTMRKYKKVIDIDKNDLQEDAILSKNNNELVIITDEDTKKTWPLLQIENISNMKTRNLSFEMFTNKRERGFVGRYAAIKALIVRTKGELSRIAHSYEQSKAIMFQDVEIMDFYDNPIQTTDYNAFVDDNIRRIVDKKVMVLKFKVLGEDDFMAYDKVSFIVSELQTALPEYKCIGEIIE